MPSSRTRESLDSFLEASPDAFIAFEPSGGIVMLNSPAAELLGYDPGDLVGQSIETVLPALKPPTVEGEPSVFPAPRFGLRPALEARQRGGTMLPIELSLTPIEVDVRPLIIARLRSLTGAPSDRPGFPRERDPHDAEQAALMRDEFLATLAHELRTPLHSMLGWTQLMRSAPRDPEMVARASEVIERNIRRQAQGIDDLIDLAEILYGRLRLEIRPVRAATIIDSVLARVSDAARSKDIQLVRSLDAEKAEILADPDRLEHVLLKLLTNALKFTSKGGRVEVRSREFDSLLRITIIDNGQGIDPDFLPRIFDNVRQADESSRRHGWPGLGLSVVRSLVEMQGGQVHAESAGPGRGASFAVSLLLAKG